MTEKTFSWDDIPSLDGGGVDWEYKPQAAADKRRYIRLNSGSLFQLFELQEISVRLATTKQTYDGTLIDISQGGLALNLPAELTLNLPVKVGFFLGREKIVSRGLVRHTKKDNKHYLTGIEFVDLAPTSLEFLASLYSSKVLYHPSV